MDKIFEKFKIYDIFGIWVPGALTVTYYLITYTSVPLFKKLYILFYPFLIKQQMIILYTAISYFVGVILHEMGKCIFDSSNVYDVNNFFDRMKKSKIVNKKHLYSPLKNIKHEVKTSFEQNGINYCKATNDDGFEKALNYLKYNNEINTNRVDTYHSIYALSRSLFVSFGIHILFLIIYICICQITDICAKQTLKDIFLIAIDVMLGFLFYIRTYRYFHSWVKNVYIQYYHERKKE